MDLSDLIYKIKRFGLENVFNRYYSVYAAQVVDNKDPEDRGRLKLKVPELLDDQVLASWAEPMLSTSGKAANISGSKTGGKFGALFPSKIDDYVWVKFRMGNLKNPVYAHGGWWAKGEKPDFLSTDRKNAVFISRFGHSITVDETDDAANIKMETNKGHTFILDDAKDSEKIQIKGGLSGNEITLFEKSGSEYILIKDKNGDEWKWDLSAKKWTVMFKGDKSETIEKTLTQVVQDAVTETFEKTLTQTVQKAVQQTFNDEWKLTVAKNGEISIGINSKIHSAAMASFFGGTLTHLGAESGTYSVPLGEALVTAMNTFITNFNGHIHTSPFLGLPTSPPSPSQGNMVPSAVLSAKVKLV